MTGTRFHNGKGYDLAGSYETKKEAMEAKKNWVEAIVRKVGFMDYRVYQLGGRVNG